MTQNSIATNILEEMSGQLVVGNWIINMNSPHGASVKIATEEEKPTLRLAESLSGHTGCWRSTPFILQQPDYNLLDRQESVKEAITAFQAGQSVEFYSPSGLGKTVLLRYLVHDHQVKSLFGDGIVSLSPLHPNVEDLLQSIWDVFYESNIPYKPTYHQICQQLHQKQALIVLDDDGLIQEELQELMNAALKCTFLIASSTSRVQKNGRSLTLSGLSINDALALMERELQRPLNTEEQPAAKLLWTLLNGHPIHLVIAMASILEEGRSLGEVVSQLPTSGAGNYLLQQVVASLSTSERTILELLTIMGSVGLESEQVTDITQTSDAFDTLEKLRRRYLVQLDGSRYKVSKTILEILAPEWKLTVALEKAIAYFVDWAERHQQQPNILLTEMDAIAKRCCEAQIAQILEVAVKDSRWKDVLRLVKAVEGTLALSKRWGLWGQVLQRGLQASQAERDKATQAWVLHQLGTRALCLEENSTAKNYLTKAIQLRESLDDGMGVAATRHNLNLLDNSPSSQTHSSQQKNLEDSAKEDDYSQPYPVQRLVTRMNIVSSENTFIGGKRVNQNVWFSPTRVITTGILASGGLLAWFNWHRFIPAPSAKSTSEPTTTVKPSSSVPKSKPRVTAPLPIIEPPSTRIVPLSPLPPATNTVSPPITPNLEDQQPTVSKHEKSKRKLTTAPVTSDAPTFIQPTPDVTIVPTPTAEATPAPTFTPLETPNVKLNQPTVETTPTPTFTPIPTPVPTPQVKAIPTPEVTITPIAEPLNSTIEKNTERRTQNTQ
ncbi:MAG: hypothetical protein KME30_07635 [Iphinoe sp. HA4291-MV1]|jgi:hypothetical protein|nr:hypothetical protein [Iphinoe sp. HA4291-MV1]